MPRKSNFFLIAILFCLLSGGCATKKVYAPSSFLRLGTIKDTSNSEEKKLGLNIAKKLSDQLGYRLSYSEVMKENLTDSLSNEKFDLILAPKSLAKDFPMLTEPQGFDKLQEELSKFTEKTLNTKTNQVDSLDDNSLTLYIYSEKSLLSSFENLISTLINQYGPSQIFSHWDIALN